MTVSGHEQSDVGIITHANNAVVCYLSVHIVWDNKGLIRHWTMRCPMPPYLDVHHA